MSVKPWLHAPTVLGAALLVVGATACTTSSGANALPTTTTTSTLVTSTAAPTTLPPATTTTVPPTTTTTTIAPEAQVVADFKATMSAFDSCVDQPRTCDPTTVSADGSPYFDSLVKFVAKLDRNGLRSKQSPQSYLVIEAVELAPGGEQATLRTCMVDASVVYDPRGNDDPTDDIIMDDLVASTHTVWDLRLTSSGWRRWHGDKTSESFGDIKCPPPGS